MITDGKTGDHNQGAPTNASKPSGRRRAFVRVDRGWQPQCLPPDGKLELGVRFGTWIAGLSALGFSYSHLLYERCGTDASAILAALERATSEVDFEQHL
jgi:hypothetical protein